MRHPHVFPRLGEGDPRVSCGSLSPHFLPCFLPSVVSLRPGENLERLLMGEIINSFVLQHNINTTLSFYPLCFQITTLAVETKVSWQIVGFITRRWICHRIVIETKWGNVTVPVQSRTWRRVVFWYPRGGGATSTCKYQNLRLLKSLNKRGVLTECNLCLVSHIFYVDCLKCSITVAAHHSSQVDLTQYSVYGKFKFCFWGNILHFFPK